MVAIAIAGPPSRVGPSRGTGARRPPASACRFGDSPPARAGRARRHDAATYRRRRIAVFGMLAAVVLAGWVGAHDLLAGPAAAGSAPAMQPIAAHVVVVQPGDTLWSIAVATGRGGDLRPLVDRLDAEVHGRPLQVGERLLVP